jgi:hypothetical protein
MNQLKAIALNERGKRMISRQLTKRDLNLPDRNDTEYTGVYLRCHPLEGKSILIPDSLRWL